MLPCLARGASQRSVKGIDKHVQRKAEARLARGRALEVFGSRRRRRCVLDGNRNWRRRGFAPLPGTCDQGRKIDPGLGGTFNQDVVAFNLRTRRVVWRYRDPDREFPYYSSAALLQRPSGLTVIVDGRDKIVHAIDAKSGKAAWKFVTRASDGKLYAVYGSKGEKQWEFNVGDAITASPAIASGRLVIGAQDGRVYCFG